MKPSLKIHDPTADTGRDAPRAGAVFDEVCVAFQKATGWTLRLREDHPITSSSDLTGSNSNTSSMGVAPGTVSLELSPGAMTAVRMPRKIAESLARAIARLLGEVAETRHALWQREAELAAGIPVAARPAEPEVFAERLDGILRGGCEAIESQAAALYLLDAATTELKLRSAWGLPRYRLTEPARSLRGATADLEALTGHAVVLANEELCRLWHAPEPAQAALCVPVSSPTVPLGTLWFFASDERDFDDRQTQLAEIVAGRIAAELEREVLLGDAASKAASEKETRAFERHVADYRGLPKVDLPGWSLAANVVGEPSAQPSFADAFVTEQDTLVVALGKSSLPAQEGHLALMAVRTAVRAHAQRLRTASTIVAAVHATVTAALPGGAPTSLALAIVHPNSGWFRCAATGGMIAAVRRPKRSRILRASPLEIGSEESVAVTEERGRIAKDEQFVLFDHDGTELDNRTMLDLLSRLSGNNAAAVMRSFEEIRTKTPANSAPCKGSALIISRSI